MIFLVMEADFDFVDQFRKDGRSFLQQGLTGEIPVDGKSRSGAVALQSMEQGYGSSAVGVVETFSPPNTYV
jgi:hypothetical protein